MKVHLDGNKTFQVSGLNVDQIRFLREFYSYTVPTRTYEWQTKRWRVTGTDTIFIPRTINVDTLEFEVGYIFSFTNLMHPQMSHGQVVEITKRFYNDGFKIENYYDLEDRDDTYELLSDLLKVKRGVLQIPTARGKTEMIATVVKNILDSGRRVLLISEVATVLDENRSRLIKLGIKVPKYFDPNSIINVIKPTGFCRSNSYNDEARSNFFNKCEFVVADEVESTVTPTFHKLFDHMPKVEYMWGFSATANKLIGEGIPKDHKLKDVLNSYSAEVIKYYGFTNDVLLPTGYLIDIYRVRTNLRIHPDIVQYHKVIQKVLSSSEFYRVVQGIVIKDGKSLLIPVNSKVAFNRLVADPLFYRDKLLQISGAGYELFDNNVKVKNVTLDECKRLIESKEVRLILGTSSSYRGINFRGLDAVLSLFEKQNSLIKQIVGRLTRSSSFSIYMMSNRERIPYLTNAYWTNMKELKNYYRKCDLKVENVEY